MSNFVSVCCFERESRKIKRKKAAIAARVCMCVRCRWFDAWQHMPVLNCSICKEIHAESWVLCEGDLPVHTHTTYIVAVYWHCLHCCCHHRCHHHTHTHSYYCVNIDTSGYCVCVYIYAVEYESGKDRKDPRHPHRISQTFMSTQSKNFKPLNSPLASIQPLSTYSYCALYFNLIIQIFALAWRSLHSIHDARILTHDGDIYLSCNFQAFSFFSIMRCTQ